MNAIDITRACAEAMGYHRIAVSNIALPGFDAAPPFVSCSFTGTSVDVLYNPLEDRAQLMELVMVLGISLKTTDKGATWGVEPASKSRLGAICTWNAPRVNLPLSICTLVALNWEL